MSKKSLFISLLVVLFLTNCSTSKTAVTATVKTIVTATDSIVAKKGAMTEAEIRKWPHDDIFTDSIPGMSLAKAYDFVKGKQGKTVIVGVIDSGIDIEHEDLKDVIWVNTDEIAGNGKDDDHNGYVDDINGWNFLGGEKGQAVPEQLEMTRIVKKWMPRFDGKSADEIADADTADYQLFVKLKKIIDKKLKGARTQIDQAGNELNRFTIIKQIVMQTNDSIQKILGDKPMNVENVSTVNFENEMLSNGKMVILSILNSGASVKDSYDELDEIIKHYKEVVDHYSNQLNAQYNIDFNGRLTGDDPYDITDIHYGNSYVIGSKDNEIHGTHVSGIIAAKRNNGIGMNGVAANVLILPVRAVPDGDEYDKDIALAIRYAVDNGAKVINMSFGKGYSPNAQWVYDAIKYAESKDVLLVHAAGNEASDIDTAEIFPTDSKDKMVEFADNVITVGAMTRHFDENLVASFSNYGKKNVDIFAPGLEIYSTFPKNSYESIQGTSMASPEVAGVAALIRSYYPKLTASQVKHIIMDSGIEFHRKVIKPIDSDRSIPEKVNFDDLSVSGRILNAYNALVLADLLSTK